jgi:hypothetical protein
MPPQQTSGVGASSAQLTAPDPFILTTTRQFPPSHKRQAAIDTKLAVLKTKGKYELAKYMIECHDLQSDDKWVREGKGELEDIALAKEFTIFTLHSTEAQLAALIEGRVQSKAKAPLWPLAEKCTTPSIYQFALVDRYFNGPSNMHVAAALSAIIRYHRPQIHPDYDREFVKALEAAVPRSLSPYADEVHDPDASFMHYPPEDIWYGEDEGGGPSDTESYNPAASSKSNRDGSDTNSQSRQQEQQEAAPTERALAYEASRVRQAAMTLVTNPMPVLHRDNGRLVFDPRAADRAHQAARSACDSLVYRVDKILRSAYIGGNLHLLVRWTGREEPTWETAENCAGCPMKISQFFIENPGAAGTYRPGSRPGCFEVVEKNDKAIDVTIDGWDAESSAWRSDLRHYRFASKRLLAGIGAFQSNLLGRNMLEPYVGGLRDVGITQNCRTSAQDLITAGRKCNRALCLWAAALNYVCPERYHYVAHRIYRQTDSVFSRTAEVFFTRLCGTLSADGGGVNKVGAGGTAVRRTRRWHLQGETGMEDARETRAIFEEYKADREARCEAFRLLQARRIEKQKEAEQLRRQIAAMEGLRSVIADSRWREEAEASDKIYAEQQRELRELERLVIAS